MKRPDSLKEIERRAYRSTFDDGIYDIAFGFAFLILAWITSLDSIGVPRFYGYMMFAILPLIAIFGKRYISTPRLGSVEFGMRRRSKKKFLAVICIAVLFLQMPLLMMTFANGTFGFLGEGLSVPVAASMIVAPLLIVAAYFIDYPRMYIYAAILFFSVPHAEFMIDFVGHPLECLISFGKPGLTILIYGVVLLSRFMKKYPLPTPEVNHAG